MFRIIFGLVFLLGIAGIFYLGNRLCKYPPFRGKKLPIRLLAYPVLPLLCYFAVKLLGISNFNIIVLLLHLVIFWLLCDLGFWLAEKIRKKKPRRYYAGITAILLTVVYLGLGWFFAHHVFVTEYTLTTKKDTPPLTIVQITDAHLGVTLNGEDFAREMEKVQAQNPDVVVITGDFVDDDSSKEDMLAACEALGKLKTPYGVFFAYGNHDDGYFRSGTFTGEELRKALTDNGVKILEDEAVLLANSTQGNVCYIVGRKDASARDRLSMEELMGDLDPEVYTVVLDHQPTDFDAEAQAKVDLVLCGHTHGGHLFPTGLVGVWFGGNDLCYGKDVRDGSTFIVSSGISGWAMPFKTGCISEIVTVRVAREK
jgi:predicted MPP superfamily phosphohydrolase